MKASKGRGKAGRSLSYVTKVQFNCNLMVGKAYTAMLDLLPGDEFELKLCSKQIKLIPLGSAGELHPCAHLPAASAGLTTWRVRTAGCLHHCVPRSLRS